MELASRGFNDVWGRMPADQQLLAAGAALLALGFALLFWTPLGNRPVARYCFGMAVLCHLLLWGVAKHLGFDGGQTESASVARRVIDIDLDPTDGSSSAAERSNSASDRLTTAVFDPRDRSAPIEAPRLPIRNKEDTPLATEPKETQTPKAPDLLKSEPQNIAAVPPPLAKPSETKEDFTPARAVDLPPANRKSEAKEPTAATPRLRDDRLAVAPDDPFAEIRIPNLPTQKTDPLDFSSRPVELATNSKSKEEIDFAPAPAPVDRPEKKVEAGKKEGASKVDSDIERISRTIRRDTPLATDSAQQIASALPVPKSPRPATLQPDVGPSLKLQTSGGSSSLDPDLAGSFAPAAAPVETAATGGSARSGPTTARKLGPGGDLSGRRSDDHRGELLRRFGGNTETEQAVAMALVWLAAHQDPSGKWDCDGFMKQCPDDDQCEGKAIEKDSDVGVTGIALLAFLGAGHTHRGDTRYRETVRKGLNWLLLEQGEDGHLMGKNKLGRVYSHAIATLALTEAYQLTADERLRPYCQKSMDWLVAAQSPELGGWRYSPRIDSDTSVFGWAVMALASGRQAGLRVPEACWSKAQTWLPKVSSGTVGELACYQPGRQPTPAMTAEALVCRQLFGLSRESELTAEAAIYLLGKMPSASEPNIYYWYYGTVAMFQVGGPRWERWNDALQQAILRGQRRTGHLKGSFDPGHPWGVDGGRVFSTATSALCLEVYYRHLPIYKETSDPR